MYNCPTRWYTVVDEMSIDELSWNPELAVHDSPSHFLSLSSAEVKYFNITGVIRGVSKVQPPSNKCIHSFIQTISIALFKSPSAQKRSRHSTDTVPEFAS